MKLRLISLAALAAIAGQAQALTIAEIAAARTAGDLIEIHFSGASALSAVTTGLFDQNCKPGTIHKFKSKNVGPFSADTANGQSVNATACQLRNPAVDGGVNTFGSAFNGKKIVFQKSDQGGSGNGVFPVAYGQALPFLNLTAATCVADVCESVSYNKAPEGGVSDVSPTGFNASFNRPLAPVDFSDANLFPSVNSANFARTEGVVQTVFGLAVSAPLYARLQADQGLASSVRPSVPFAVISTMLSASFDPSLSWKPLLPNTPDTVTFTNGDGATVPVNSQQVNICRRVNGSGTQTSANRFWLEYPFNSVSLLPATNAGNSEYANTIDGAVNTSLIHVFEGSSTSNVRSCLDKANDNNAFAIGHVSLENAETAKWKFAKIDGVEASRDNAKKGFYHYLFESTMQIRNAPSAVGGSVPSATQLAFLNAFISASSSPTALKALPDVNENGIAALPTAAACAAEAFGAYTNADATQFCSRVRRENASDPITVVR